MIVRDISRDMIRDTLSQPFEIVHGKYGRKIAHKLVGDKLLRVIFEVREKTYIIVTAYFTQPWRYIKHEDNV